MDRYLFFKRLSKLARNAFLGCIILTVVGWYLGIKSDVPTFGALILLVSMPGTGFSFLAWLFFALLAFASRPATAAELKDVAEKR